VTSCGLRARLLQSAAATLVASTLLVTKLNRNKLATLKYKPNYPIQRMLEGHYPLVLTHRAMWTERQLSQFILPIDISYLRNAAPRHLRGKLKAFPNLIVEAFLQLVLRSRLVLESFPCYPVSRFAEAFDHPKQGATLLLGKFQFDHDGQLHASIILHHTDRSPPKRESSITRRLGRSFHLPARLKRDAAWERIRRAV
jgi:hypothetical protein